MKQFLLDYSVLYKASIAFWKKHWIAMLVYMVISVLLFFTPWIIDIIREKIDQKKCKRNLSKEES